MERCPSVHSERLISKPECKKQNRPFTSGFASVTPKGFEPPTNRTGICHSIQLNYGARDCKGNTILEIFLYNFWFRNLSFYPAWRLAPGGGLAPPLNYGARDYKGNTIPEIFPDIF
jgi:hypothetical protein